MANIDIIITGTSKSGKTSIKRVVFEKMSPHESVFNEETKKIESSDLESLGCCKLSVTEFPANYKYSENDEEGAKYLEKCGVLIFVINSQEETNIHQYAYFKDNILPIFATYKDISLVIFNHKIDNINNGLTDKTRREEIQYFFQDMLNIFKKEENINDINYSVYNTSIYNSSLFGAFSWIFQEKIKRNRHLSTLIDDLASGCRFKKAYLFDVFNKIYLAINSSSIDPKTFEVCSDMIDVILDMSGIYQSSSDFDENSNCSIKINHTDEEGNDSKIIVLLRFIDCNLALIGMIDEELYERTHLLDYNINLFRKAVQDIIKPKTD